MATYDFHGELRTPCPLCLCLYQSFKQFEFTFYLFIFLKRLLISSADAKGKDSMILFKIKETAHINFRPRVVLKFGVARDDGLDARKCTLHIKQWPRRYEQVEQGSCANPGFFVRRGGGGGGVEARRPENSLDNVFFSVINLFYSLQSGSNGFITEGRRGSNFFQGVGVSKETHITCDFPEAGSGSPNPPLDPHVGLPDVTVCLQNHGLSKFK